MSPWWIDEPLIYPEKTFTIVVEEGTFFPIGGKR
jgi:hypothetical protein